MRLRHLIALLVALLLTNFVTAQTQLKVPSAGYGMIAWHPQGHFVALSNTAMIDIYTADIQFIYRIDIGDETTTTENLSIAWSPNGRYLVASMSVYSLINTSRVETLYLWDAVTFTQIKTISGVNGVGTLSWSADSTLIAATYQNPDDDNPFQDVGIYKVSSGQRIGSLPIGPWRHMVWSRSANEIIIAAGDISIWDTTTYQKIAVLTNNADTERPFTLRPDGYQIAFVQLDEVSNIEIRDIRTSQLIRILDSPSSVYDLDWGVKGIISASFDGARIWNTQTGNVQFLASSRIQAIRWHPSGTSFISLHSDGSIALRDTVTGENIATLIPDAPLTTITPSPVIATPTHTGE
jgi:WD40 repeat protein